MRIVEIIPRLQTGGAEKFVVELANTFVEQGHECTLVTLFDLDESDVIAGDLQPQVRRISLHKHAGADLGCFWRVLEVIKREKPNIVHAHVGAIKYLSLAALIFRQCHYFATIHSEASREAGTGLELWSRRLLFNRKLVVPVTISPESHKSFQQFYGWPTPMIMNGCSAYKPSNIDVTRLGFRDGIDLLFVHAARISEVKNQTVLVRAFKRLLADGYRVRLLIMGRCDSDQIMEEIRLAESESLVYLGERTDIRDIMAIADAFCLTSRQEGMPITLIEAFSVGCPPIVTPVGGCVNMVKHGTNGLLAQDCTEDGYYSALKEYVSLIDDQRMQMKAEAYKSYSLYSIQETANQYINIFQQANDKN